MSRFTPSHAATLATLAGAAAFAVPPAVAQNQMREQRQQDRQVQQPQTQRSIAGHTTVLRFHLADSLFDTDIVNLEGEDLGEIEDLLIDRGSGRIEYIVVEAGGFLGIGDNEVAVPYAEFMFDPDADRFVLDADEDIFDDDDERRPANWIDLDEDDWRERLERQYARDRGDRDEAYRAGVDRQRVTLDGTVRSVERVDRATAENIVVGIEDAEGNLSRVVLGPAWFVMNEDAAPMRGDEISVEAVEMRHDGRTRIVAHSATIAGEEVRFRENNGRPLWSEARGARRGSVDARDSNEYRRQTRVRPVGDRRDTRRRRGGPLDGSPIMPLSDLMDLDVTTRDRNEEVGEIEDVVIEVNSGQVAILAFDPDDSWFDLGDEDKAVPWSVVSAVTDEMIRIDTDSDTLIGAEPLPDDVAVYAEAGRLEPIYEIYRVDVYRFEPRDSERYRQRTRFDEQRREQTERREARERRMQRELWSSDGALATALDDADDASLEGIVSDITTVGLTGRNGRAAALRIDTGGDVRTVILGPKSWFERQQIDLVPGDRVSIDAREIMLDNERHTLAATLTTEDGRNRYVMWDNGTPTWDGR